MPGGSSRHLSASDAELIEQLKLAPKLLSVDPAAEQLPIFLDGGFYLRRRFIQKLDAEMARTQGDHALDIFRPRLRQRIEDRVAATNVSFDGVLGADAVAQL